MKSAAVRKRKIVAPPADGQHRVQQQLRDALHDEHPGHDRGGPKQEANRRRDHGGGDEDRRQILPADLAVDEDADDERVEHGDDRRFRGRHHPAQDAAEDDDGQPERDERIDDHTPDLGQVHAHGGVDAAPLGVVVDPRHDRYRQDDRPQEARRKQRGHRDIAHGADHDHEDAGRDEDPHRGRRRHHGHRLLGAIAGAEHGGDHRGADGRDVGHRGAGDSREHVLGDDDRHRQPAADPAHQRLGETHEPHRDASRLHKRAGQDEQRDGEQHERVHTLERLLEHGEHRVPAVPHQRPSTAAMPTAKATGTARSRRTTKASAVRRTITGGARDRAARTGP
jgi:hypothetical protein